METLVTKIWEVGDLPWKESDNLCEENFVRTTNRSLDGKNVLSLPFKDS